VEALTDADEEGFVFNSRCLADLVMGLPREPLVGRDGRAIGWECVADRERVVGRDCAAGDGARGSCLERDEEE
jgi:hypothetical protein